MADAGTLFRNPKMKIVAKSRMAMLRLTLASTAAPLLLNLLANFDPQSPRKRSPFGTSFNLTIMEDQRGLPSSGGNRMPVLQRNSTA
jgi:hypothetical protein